MGSQMLSNANMLDPSAFGGSHPPNRISTIADSRPADQSNFQSMAKGTDRPLFVNSSSGSLLPCAIALYRQLSVASAQQMPVPPSHFWTAGSSHGQCTCPQMHGVHALVLPACGMACGLRACPVDQFNDRGAMGPSDRGTNVLGQLWRMQLFMLQSQQSVYHCSCLGVLRCACACACA